MSLNEKRKVDYRYCSPTMIDARKLELGLKDCRNIRARQQSATGVRKTAIPVDYSSIVPTACIAVDEIFRTKGTKY